MAVNEVSGLKDVTHAIQGSGSGEKRAPTDRMQFWRKYHSTSADTLRGESLAIELEQHLQLPKTTSLAY